METLSNMWENFSLTESEGNKYQVLDSGSVGQYLLAAKFFTGRALNMEAVARTFKLLWHKKKGFERLRMWTKFLGGEPWSFDKSLVALKRVQQYTDVKGIEFDSASFWIQVHDLPLSGMTLEVVKDIVSTAGTIINCEAENEEYVGGNFMRVRVNVDLTKPLCRGRKLGFSSGVDSWVSFKYERLPNVCYWCGRLTHHDKDCSLWQKSKGSLKKGEQQFGPWLRAIAPNLAKKSVVRVEGYEDGEDDKASHDPNHRRTDSASQGGLVDDLDCNAHDRKQCDQEGDGGTTVDDMNGLDNVQMSPSNNTLSPTCLIPTETVAQTSPNFQAQLDSIDKDLVRFDNVVEGEGNDLKAQPGGVGSKVVGSAKFLKNLFTQSETCSNMTKHSKPSQVSWSSISERFAVGSAKRLREIRLPNMNLVAGASSKGFISGILSGTYLPRDGTLHDG
ncbi:hypothetical protein SO802_031668 [Lithocarpus litseifolius]|uniref:Zinc knuckle CX2CX4HX4C domain-containing protein n=1 Tax=Lithocarpus litseifolius TaxID=425828 RepID=A0AAW2BNJ0_9ROSI